MRKLIGSFVAFSLLLVACAGDEVGSSSTATPDPNPPVTTIPATTTGLPPVVTTADVVEATSTTATPIRPVTAHANLPSALSGSDVPWDEVAGNWYLALYSATLTNEPFTEGPTVLYLANGMGQRFEVASWSAAEAPFAIADWRPDGLAVAVVVYSAVDDSYEIVEVDLASGDERALFVSTGDEFFGSAAGPLEYTRPTGKNLVVYRNDGAVEWIERVDRGGATIAEIARKPYDDWATALSWLYGVDGTELIVGGDSLSRRAIDGTLINEMWSPPGELCVPVRWWDDELVLATCHGDVPSLPHEYYNVLWTIPRSGGIGEPIIGVPEGDIGIVYFGYQDALPWSDPVYLEAGGDCGAGWVEYRGDDGLGYRLPGPEWDHGLVDVLADGLVLNTWRDCDRSSGELILTDREGNLVEYLVPLTGEIGGVIDVATL